MCTLSPPSVRGLGALKGAELPWLFTLVPGSVNHNRVNKLPFHEGPLYPLDLIHDTIGLCVKLCHGVILMGCPAAYVTTVTGYCHFKVTDT